MSQLARGPIPLDTRPKRSQTVIQLLGYTPTYWLELEGREMFSLALGNFKENPPALMFTVEFG